MPAGADLRSEVEPEAGPSFRPTVAACPSCPERVVFIEADNTDGWLSTDLTVEAKR